MSQFIQSYGMWILIALFLGLVLIMSRRRGMSGGGCCGGSHGADHAGHDQGAAGGTDSQGADPDKEKTTRRGCCG